MLQWGYSQRTASSGDSVANRYIYFSPSFLEKPIYFNTCINFQGSTATRDNYSYGYLQDSGNTVTPLTKDYAYIRSHTRFNVYWIAIGKA